MDGQVKRNQGGDQKPDQETENERGDEKIAGDIAAL
jgi:hypothetical protein